MKSFKELGITAQTEIFIGKKRAVDEILNIPIQVHKFKIEPSKKNSGLCLHLQIKIGETYHVVFTSGSYLMECIKQVPETDFPFTTTIITNDRRYEFT
jgi:hypothetical protein